MDAAELLGLPLIPAFSQVSNSRDQMARGVNFASAASGILDITGRNFVSILLDWFLFMCICRRLVIVSPCVWQFIY